MKVREADYECMRCGTKFPQDEMLFNGRILDCPSCHSSGVVKLPDDKTYMTCGCVFWTDGQEFKIQSCSFGCEVYRYCVEQTKEQGKQVEYRVET